MFITFEGIEGAGKGTQIGMLRQRLEARGMSVLLTREPGGSRIGRELRAMLLSMESRDLTGQAELFLYLADRAQHVAQVVRPALEEGKIVLCDRFADSTVAYQGYGRGLDPTLLNAFNKTATAGLSPDLTLLLDLDPEQGLSRALARDLRSGKANIEGRFEAESLAFHARVREGYLTLAALNPERFRIVEASRSPEEVFADVAAAVDAALSSRSRG